MRPMELLPRLARDGDWQRDEAGPPRREYLVFDVGGEEYGIDLLRLREIVRHRTATEVPRTPPFIRGVVAIRGEVMPQIDLARRLRLPEAASRPAARSLIVPRGDESFALLVDRVRGVIRLGDDQIEPAPRLFTGDGEFVAGIGRLGPRLVLLLDLDGILRFNLGEGRRALAAKATP